MNFVTVTAELRARLNGLGEPLDFCDEEGRLLGRFVPAIAQPGDLAPAIPAEELHRRAEHFQGRPLAELLAEWEKRK